MSKERSKMRYEQESTTQPIMIYNEFCTTSMASHSLNLRWQIANRKPDYDELTVLNNIEKYLREEQAAYMKAKSRNKGVPTKVHNPFLDSKIELCFNKLKQAGLITRVSPLNRSEGYDHRSRDGSSRRSEGGSKTKPPFGHEPYKSAERVWDTLSRDRQDRDTSNANRTVERRISPLDKRHCTFGTPKHRLSDNLLVPKKPRQIFSYRYNSDGYVKEPRSIALDLRKIAHLWPSQNIMPYQIIDNAVRVIERVFNEHRYMSKNRPRTNDADIQKCTTKGCQYANGHPNCFYCTEHCISFFSARLWYPIIGAYLITMSTVSFANCHEDFKELYRRVMAKTKGLCQCEEHESEKNTFHSMATALAKGFWQAYPETDLMHLLKQHIETEEEGNKAYHEETTRVRHVRSDSRDREYSSRQQKRSLLQETHPSTLKPSRAQISGNTLFALKNNGKKTTLLSSKPPPTKTNESSRPPTVDNSSPDGTVALSSEDAQILTSRRLREENELREKALRERADEEERQALQSRHEQEKQEKRKKREDERVAAMNKLIQENEQRMQAEREDRDRAEQARLQRANELLSMKDHRIRDGSSKHHGNTILPSSEPPQTTSKRIVSRFDVPYTLMPRIITEPASTTPTACGAPSQLSKSLSEANSTTSIASVKPSKSPIFGFDSKFDVSTVEENDYMDLSDSSDEPVSKPPSAVISEAPSHVTDTGPSIASKESTINKTQTTVPMSSITKEVEQRKRAEIRASSAQSSVGSRPGSEDYWDPFSSRNPAPIVYAPNLLQVTDLRPGALNAPTPFSEKYRSQLALRKKASSQSIDSQLMPSNGDHSLDSSDDNLVVMIDAVNSSQDTDTTHGIHSCIDDMQSDATPKEPSTPLKPSAKAPLQRVTTSNTNSPVVKRVLVKCPPPLPSKINLAEEARLSRKRIGPEGSMRSKIAEKDILAKDLYLKLKKTDKEIKSMFKFIDSLPALGDISFSDDDEMVAIQHKAPESNVPRVFTAGTLGDVHLDKGGVDDHTIKPTSSHVIDSISPYDCTAVPVLDQTRVPKYCKKMLLPGQPWKPKPIPTWKPKLTPKPLKPLTPQVKGPSYPPLPKPPNEKPSHNPSNWNVCRVPPTNTQGRFDVAPKSMEHNFNVQQMYHHYSPYAPYQFYQRQPPQMGNQMYYHQQYYPMPHPMSYGQQNNYQQTSTHTTMPPANQLINSQPDTAHGYNRMQENYKGNQMPPYQE